MVVPFFNFLCIFLYSYNHKTLILLLLLTLTKYPSIHLQQYNKLYLSVILDLCDRRPVAFVYSTRNDNPLVFDTFDKAVAANPGATPLLHSDRGYQYTSKAFRRRILAAGMTQSMSRVARCIDNGPMEGFWGLMKREMYYGKKYKTKEELMLAIEKYIDYYTNKEPVKKSL